jgi:type VI secretion system protein VasD
VDVLNKPPTADQLAAAQKAKDADPTLTDKVQDAVIKKPPTPPASRPATPWIQPSTL